MTKRFTNPITKTDADGTIHTNGILDANEDNKILITNYFYIAQVMNKLHEENEQLKQQIKDLYKFVKYDVDNEIDVYPKSILEHLVNILKIIGDVE